MSYAMVAVGSLVVGGVGSLVGSKMQSDAARDAADKQVDAAREANALQEKIYHQNRADQEPWRQAGAGALSQLGNADFQRDFSMADYQQDPGYEFRMREGQKALERSAAARGGLQSGGTLKALSRYGQDYASNEYQNAYNRFNADRDRRFNRLSSIAGLGQTANSQIGVAGQNYANNMGNNLMGAANAQGAAGIASANAWGNSLSNIGKMGMDAASIMGQQGKWMDQWKANQGAPMGGGTSLSSFWSKNPFSG